MLDENGNVLSEAHYQKEQIHYYGTEKMIININNDFRLIRPDEIDYYPELGSSFNLVRYLELVKFLG